MNLRSNLAGFAAVALIAVAAPALAKTSPMMGDSSNPMVGGHAMMANKDIVANAVNSDDNKTLVAAVKAAGLVATLEGPGPFTVFAPTDEAFSALPAGTVDTLVKPENKAALTNIPITSFRVASISRRSRHRFVRAAVRPRSKPFRAKRLRRR
jgi:uncharacterized surface protein with fasciclin (FAS1) repeats